jgi:protein-tyrosine phosphatase
MTVSVLFVCLGNICRSPTAHGVFEKIINDRVLSDSIRIDSAGTGDWHIGHAPDERAIKSAEKRDYDLSHLRARKVTVNDFDNFDYILAMDCENLSVLESMKPTAYQGQLSLFLDFNEFSEVREVPDPYYEATDCFDQVLNLVESASEGLLQDILKKIPAK